MVCGSHVPILSIEEISRRSGRPRRQDPAQNPSWPSEPVPFRTAALAETWRCPREASHTGDGVPCGAVEDRRVETVALARARAVSGDKPLETCDNDEKETTTTFTVAREDNVVIPPSRVRSLSHTDTYVTVYVYHAARLFRRCEV